MRSRGILLGVALGSMLLAGCSGEAPYGTDMQDAIRAYDEGMDDLGKFYYAEALKAFERATEVDSGFAIAWARMAQINFRMSNLGEARSAISRALNSKARATPREAYYIRMLDFMISYSYDSAASVTDELLRNYPHDKEAYLQRGILFEIERDYEQAIRMYHRASELDSGYAQAIMCLGYAYSTIGEQEKALTFMKRYVKLAPEAGDPRASYADLLVRMGHYQDALEQYQKSLKIKPDYWYSMQQIARVYAIMGRLRESETYMRQGIDLLPPTVNRKVLFLITSAGLDMNRGKYREAADQYREALTVDSLSGGAAFGLCGAFIRLEQPTLAREVLAGIHAELGRRNLLESPAMLDYYLVRSRIALAEDEPAVARADCDTALMHATLLTRPYIYRQIAEINLSTKDFQSALSACEEALAPNSSDPSILLTLTRIYHAMGDVRMTQEIGSRLSAFWSNADPDFIRLKELKRLLLRAAAA